MPVFKDHFSKHADLYATYRPHYPPALYAYLSTLTGQHELAWDCGTGNGQAAVGLTAFYAKIIATDPSEQQISRAWPHAKITYAVEKAEDTSIASNSVDLITMANALHWFNFDLFYTEAKRVLKSNGIIAAWAYGLPSVSPAVDEIIRQLHDETLNGYWLPENRLVEAAYTTIPFPFPEINSPAFFLEKTMQLDDFIGFLNTWSATQRFIRENKFNPTERVRNDLMTVWQTDQAAQKVTWELILKVGRAG